MTAVLALHAGLLIVLIKARTPARGTRPPGFVSTFILLPEQPAAAPRRERPKANYELAPVAPVEPLIAPPQISLPSTPDTSIDWDAESEHAADAVTVHRLRGSPDRAAGRAGPFRPHEHGLRGQFAAAG